MAVKAVSATHLSGSAHAGGRPHAPGTELASMMTRRRMRVSAISAALGVSDRQVYRYLTRQRPLTIIQVAALVRLMDVEPEELVDRRGYLLKEKTKERK